MAWQSVRIFLLTLLMAALSAGWARSQDKGDLLDQAARRQQVAAQALTLEIEDALKQADKLKVSDSAKATQILSLALKKLEGDTSLPIAKAASLRLTLRERIEAIETGKAKAEAEAAQKQAAEIDRRITQLQAQKDQTEALKRDLDILRSMKQEGKLAEAQRLAEELSRKYPNNVSVSQQQQTAGIGDRIREANQIVQEKSLASNAAMNDALRSGIPNPNDITYPSREKWKKLTEDRKKRFGEIPMTEKEKQIVAALDEVVPAPTQIKDESFEKVLDYLSKLIGQPILVNKASLRELDISYERTLSVALPKGITKRSILRSTLAELGLTYIIKNETIEVMDIERAKNNLTTRVYPVDDLVAFAQFFPSGNANGKTPVDQIIDLIQDQVEPLSWQKYNGPGTITYYAPQRVLIIKNTAEVINMIGGGRAR